MSQIDSRASIRSSISSQHSINQGDSPEIELDLFDKKSAGNKKSFGSNISLSSISKSFSKKSHVSNFATSVRRKFSENHGKNVMKNVLGKHLDENIFSSINKL